VWEGEQVLKRRKSLLAAPMAGLNSRRTSSEAHLMWALVRLLALALALVLAVVLVLVVLVVRA
jgi:hypothetical protein